MPRLLTALLLVFFCSSVFAQVEGRFGQALLAHDRYAVAPPNPVYTVMPLTVECWAKLTSKSAYNIIAANEPKHSVTHWEILADKTTGYFAAYLPAFSQPEIKSKIDIVDGQWHYLALICDGQTAKLFVDAKEVAGAKLAKKFSYPDVGPLTFGQIEGVDTTKDAVIDEVRISRVVRPIDKTPDQPFTTDADTVGLWHFDGDGKSGYPDVSTTKNPATLKSRAITAPVASSKNRWAEMDFGPFFTSTLVLPAQKGNVAYKGISVRLGSKEKPAAICFDTETLRVMAGWTGGFVKIYPAREGLAQPMDADGKTAFSTLPGPGWTRADVMKGEAIKFDDPRPDKLGPLPAAEAKYRGLYVNGARVIFAYTIGETEILESHDYIPPGDAGGEPAFVRTFEVAAAKQPLICRLVNVPGPVKTISSKDWAALEKDGTQIAAGRVGAASVQLGAESDGATLFATVPPRNEPIRFKIILRAGPAGAIDTIESLLKSAEPIELSTLIKGGPPRWGDPLITKGKLGDSQTENSAPSTLNSAYVVDTLTAPEDNPFKSYLRFGGHDFFKNGDMAICSISGDVWIVSGIDDKLEKLTWRRFATGLHQPLGLRIIDDRVYVLGRDQITRLHDLNNDGEADFYENFNNDCKVTTNGHGYCTNLETDPEGNFYYTKCADNTNFGGTVVKVSKDGKYAEPFAVGLRNPNGMGISPTGFITEADNQGEWVPASRIDFVEPGKFLGFKPSAHEVPAPDMGKPICFMPQNVDNSSGGQVWAPADSDRWGPFKGDMLHTSYGAGTLLHVMVERVSDTWQGGVVSFPLKFDTGIMRGRFNPHDGQLYVSGLRGWQNAGLRSGAVQRVRYTGKPVYMPKELHSYQNGVTLTFPTALDPVSANDAGNYSVLRWTYKWTGDYPSRHFSVKEPNKQGYDTVDVKSAKLSKDGKTLFIEIPDIQVVKQQQITLNLKAVDGADVHWDVYQTINDLNPAFAADAKAGFAN